MSDLVSAIITTYKGTEFISDAINCLISQTYDNIEIIVVDDNGINTEEQIKTEQIINLFNDKRIKYICHEINRNGASARNTGIRASKGKYIAFLDNDDLFLPSHIERCVSAIESEDFGCVICDTFMTYRTQIYEYSKADKENLSNRLLLHKSGLYTGSNIFVRKDNVIKIGGFDEKFIRYQDIEFMIRYLEVSPNVSILNVPTILKRNNGDSNTPNYKKTYEINQIFNKKFKYLIDELNSEEKMAMDLAIAENNFSNAEKSGDRIAINRTISELKQFRELTFEDKIKRDAGYFHLGKLLTKLGILYKYIKNRHIINYQVNNLCNKDKTYLKSLHMK